jgi:hypothetical protein
VLLRALALATVLLVASPADGASARTPAPTAGAAHVAARARSTLGAGDVPRTVTTDDDTTPPTINEFYPEDRALSDCLSAVPKPGCGSKARGGWHQTLVFLTIVGGLLFILWRVVASSRSARRARATGPRMPAATTARDDPGDVRAP